MGFDIEFEPDKVDLEFELADLRKSEILDREWRRVVIRDNKLEIK